MIENPIEMDIKKAVVVGKDEPMALRTFESYSFDRNILTPASPFRFTAPGVDKALRVAIRSGDMTSLYVSDDDGNKFPLAVGIVDETDCHVIPNRVEYVLTGRDLLGQLVDNSVIDASNKIINTTNLTLENILSTLIKGTRIPAGFQSQQVPNGKLLFQTNAGETKINALQRYLEFTNTLIWSQPNGQLVLGKPDFTKGKSGALIMNASSPESNNAIDARARRDVNRAIRQIVTQLSSLDQVDAGSFTKLNNDQDMQDVAAALVGRSVYRKFNYGSGNDVVNQVTAVGNQSGNPRKIGDELSLRELARENMKILDVEMVCRGHFNEQGEPYNIDQIYSVTMEDDDVNEDMYVYSCNYELTKDHGLLTRLRLCRLGTICAYADALARAKAGT